MNSEYPNIMFKFPLVNVIVIAKVIEKNPKNLISKKIKEQSVDLCEHFFEKLIMLP